jgi:hypothetical protein
MGEVRDRAATEAPATISRMRDYGYVSKDAAPNFVTRQRDKLAAGEDSRRRPRVDITPSVLPLRPGANRSQVSGFRCVTRGQ